MGSKRAMLRGGLGDLILDCVRDSGRFFDLFTGSGAVASYVAQRAPVSVHATDLQLFATVLAAAVVERTVPLRVETIWSDWRRAAEAELEAADMYDACKAFDEEDWERARRVAVMAARDVCEADNGWSFAASYGGHYYSPKQAYGLEALRRTVPAGEPISRLCMAALVIAASQCAASPGHTAQPFAATREGARFLFEAWRRNAFTRTYDALTELASQCARAQGRAWVAEARGVATSLAPGDIVFIDPPYSAVQYSRFYHVLESLARGTCGSVSGVGRYPPRQERPTSAYSGTRTAKEAMRALLGTLAERRATAILTFPRDVASNGLSGSDIDAIGRQLFKVDRYEFNGRFSTLGGGPASRGARMPAYELVLVLKPR